VATEITTPPIEEKKSPLVNPYPSAPTNNGVKEEIPLIESLGNKLFNFPKREKGST
jgi:hypothetical protein